MNWKINSIWVLVIGVWLACQQKSTEESNEYASYYSTDHIIEVDELKSIIHRPKLKYIDFRKKESYETGHLAEARNIYRTDISSDEYPYGGMMASKEKLEELFTDLGITRRDQVIIYDDKWGCDAARLWWVLEQYGFEHAKILNGGLDAWKKSGGVVTKALPQIDTSKPEKFRFKKRRRNKKNTLVSLEEIIERTPNIKLLDTRSQDEFSGKRQKKGASSGGRIPGAKLVDWATAVNYHGDGKFKSHAELYNIYKSAGFDKNDTIFVYCHSGVRSAHTTFVLTELLGYPNVKNYDGSWTEWSYHTDLPVEKDSVTTNID